jgi:Arc/MetJ family transcription regulator
MRLTLTLDDALLAKAEEYTGISDKSALIHAALRALVEREAARRLVASAAASLPIPRRRMKRG